MNRVEIADGVYWVGAIDWNLRDFHGYLTPRGTTYNAYIIKDSVVALVDTVKAGFFDELRRRIEAITDPGIIDYVIVNHVEMDHSGSLSRVMEVASDATVVATEKGSEELQMLYDCDGWAIKTVKTGDTVSLGEKTLSFIETPMLHWPDNMVTYVAEDRLLLSNDAFGQHIASSKRYSDEYPGVLDDAAKYYANILMPFSPLIAKTLQKIGEMEIEIDVIAPSHGMIWRDPGIILDAYQGWSSGESNDTAILVYDTMWGSTEKMALAIAQGIIDAGFEVKVYHLRRSDWSEIVREILEAKIVLVGSPTINNGIFPSVGGFLTYLRGLRPKDKVGFAFGSYGWGGGAVKAIESELEKTGIKVVDSISVKFVPGADDLDACARLAWKVVDEARNFNSAISHP
ncbi:MAG TPA: FprA family A-type flavoprotein [Methanosarcinales archaeon]|nr:FprA family A-type flavoprotein [Methanosarcinales archaeon]